MAYCVPRMPSKKALKEAVKNGQKIQVFQPTPWGNDPVTQGSAVLEMPPEYHKWYAGVEVKDGYIVKVKS